MTASIVVLGIFVADATFRGSRLPKMGETRLGTGFALGPGGKGSNQAVAAGKAGGDVIMISRLGDDAFADMAEAAWKQAGVASAAIRDPASYTGAASIFVDEATGDNAIIVAPGAAEEISVADIEAQGDTIRNARVFVTQLEQPIGPAAHALAMARGAGVATILNPAPAADLTDAMLANCDYLTPNESEAETLTDLPVETIEEARAAALELRERGVGTVVVTLGERGAVVVGPDVDAHIEAFEVGRVVETTGAGDAFNGAFAVALGEGLGAEDATRFGCAAASISVTRRGAAASSPSRAEIDALLCAFGPAS